VNNANYRGDATNTMTIRAIGPAITEQPQSIAVEVGTNLTLRVVATGSPLVYQWFQGGLALAGANSPSLTFSTVALTNAGNYTVVVSNTAGVQISSNAVLAVRPVGAPIVRVDGQLVVGSVTKLGSAVVTMEDSHSNGTIFFTLDGSVPGLESYGYSGPVTLNHSSTIRSVGYDSIFLRSDEILPVTVVVLPFLKFSAISAGGGNATLTPPGGSYEPGLNVNVTATAMPAAGWVFMGWMGDSLSTESSLTYAMTNNRSLSAVFGTSLTRSVTGSGTVEVSPALPPYPYGSTARLTGIPATGYYFATWGGDASGTNNPLNFVVTNSNPSVTCLFLALPGTQRALTVLSDGFGRVNSTPRGNRFNSGQMVTLTAVPDAKQVFLGWTGDVVSTNNPLTITLNASKTIGAQFTTLPVLQPDSVNDSIMADGFRLLLKSEFGARIGLDWSSNLSDWTRLTTLTNRFGTLWLLDNSAAAAPLRFYRVVNE